MKKSCCSILVVPLFVLLFPAAGFSLSLDDLHAVEPGLTQAQAESLLTTGSLTRFFQPHERAALVPNCALAPRIEADMSSVDYSIGVEVLFVTKPGEDANSDPLLGWFNILRSISTLKGVQYYSVLDGKMRVLFSDSYAVDNPTDKKRIPDPLVVSLPPESSITIMQNDTRFGTNYYGVRYLTAPDAISMTMTNITTLSLLFIPVISPQDMQLHLVVLPYKGSRLFYGSVVVRVGTMLGLQGIVRDSFHNRIDALYGWFKSMADKTGT